MTSASSSHPEGNSSGISTCLRRAAAAVALLFLFVAAHGGTLAAFLQQGAPLAEPGDRLLVVFPRGTALPEALQLLGEAGAVISSTGGAPAFYLAEAIDRSAGRVLAERAITLRLPPEPTLQGCFGMVSGEN